jgi:glycosyltransferase involved in cell wall biosynthesis
VKIGAMTCCWNEQTTIAYTIASLLPSVDCYVVVDTGSTDNTLKIIKTLFEKDIKYGKLILIEYGALEDYDISKPKNEAIQTLRAEGCVRFIRLDGDDVFYLYGAEKAVRAAKELPDDVTMFTINHWELYQNKYQNSLDWTDGLYMEVMGLKKPDFMCMRIPPAYEGRFTGSYGHARIYRTEGAVSLGKWTDEAWGKGPGEDIGHPGCVRKCIGDYSEDIVHYGWARPMDKKMRKNNIWTHGEAVDLRVTGLEERWEVIDKPNLDRMTYGFNWWPKQILFPFTNHPEIVTGIAPMVKELLV